MGSPTSLRTPLQQLWPGGADVIHCGTITPGDISAALPMTDLAGDLVRHQSTSQVGDNLRRTAIPVSRGATPSSEINCPSFYDEIGKQSTACAALSVSLPESIATRMHRGWGVYIHGCVDLWARSRAMERGRGWARLSQTISASLLSASVMGVRAV